MRRKLPYIILTIVAFLVANWLPLHASRIIEGGEAVATSTPRAKTLPKATYASFKQLEPVDTQPTPKPVTAAPVSSYAGSGDEYLDYIVQHESSGNPYAVNSIGACGLFQALPCSKLGCDLSDVPCQLAWGRGYAISRYGSTYNAYLFWVANHYW